MTKDIRDKLWEITWDNDRALPVDAEPRQVPTVGDLHLAIAEIDRLRFTLGATSKERDRAVLAMLRLENRFHNLRAAYRVLHGGDDLKVWQHVKRGSLYVEIGTATAQIASGRPIVEDDKLVIYRGEAGALWARRVSEFHDGRFIEPRTEELAR